MTPAGIEPATFGFVVKIQGVPKPMSQTSPGYSPPLIKQKSSYQHGSESEKLPRYPLLHFSLITRQYLNDHFPGKWIGRNGPVEWPPRSPDLNPIDL